MILWNPSLRRDFFLLTCWLFLLFFSAPVFSQGIIGFVRDDASLQPIEGVVVQILLRDSVIGSLTTDAEGRYDFVTTLAGKVDVDIQHLGYSQVTTRGIQLDGYATHRIEHFIPAKIFELEEVSTTASWETSRIEITPEDLKNTAANFDDPVRVAVSEPGIVQINDQANHLSVRGQNPLFNTWFLEGLEIVNPNHTNNAGTFSDQPVQSGGGVNMFSAQILGRTDFYTGINPLSIGRSAGGVIDMHLHETVKSETRVKAGLLGFELGGGKALGSQGVLDVNLRYSFTGLLADLGVDFGGEKIGFNDAVISYTNIGSNHKVKVFGWGGTSKNIFEHTDSTETRERYKDFFDIEYRNQILGAGVRYDQVLGEKLFFTSGAAYSTLNTSYDKVGFFSPVSEVLHLDQTYKLATALIEFDIQHSPKFNTEAGINFTNKTIKGNQEVLMPFINESFLRPYINFRLGTSISTWLLDAGAEFNSSFYTFSKTAPGYRINLQYRISNTLTTYIGTRHGGAQNVTAIGAFESINQPLIVDKYEFGIKYADRINSFAFKPYLQEIKHLPVFFTSSGYIHLADQSDPIVGSAFLARNNDGQARFYGVEADWKFRSENGFKITANQTLYKSIRNGADNEFESSKFDGSYASHITLAKELYNVRKEKNRIWNFSLRGILNGGLLHQVIDVTASEMAEQTIFQNPGNYVERLPAYKRVDASISRTIANANSRWRIALDIQNLLNFSNAAFRYYDPYLNQIITQEQLGIVPVLSVQLSW